MLDVHQIPLYHLVEHGRFAGAYTVASMFLTMPAVACPVHRSTTVLKLSLPLDSFNHLQILSDFESLLKPEAKLQSRYQI